ncbi:MAG: hypothetical protein JRD93_20040 [Deltaproteobacteria bacterium]|nr:hypothetical protein [Deltaproteobacteria bacterium]
MTNTSIRDYLTSEERSLPLEHTVDPGFVHKRKLQTILGPEGMRIVDEMISRIPPLSEWQREVRIDHIYKNIFLEFCKIHGIKTLEEVLSEEKGRMICSTVTLAACKNVYDSQRAVSVWVPRSNDCKRRVEFHYSTDLIASDTLKSELYQGGDVSVVAELYSATEEVLVFHPLIMGFPWLRTSDPAWEDKIMWWNRNFFENFIEDFNEFSEVKKYEKPHDFKPMKQISEQAFKKALGKILGDQISKDWGGETSDHFTSHLHLTGRRVTAAFLLKGPARFSPMGLNHLGKNNDQIVRLAQEPADVLVVQHCHEIMPPVRSTLRAFAVQPYGARRYCLIDGKDSLWLLQAYGLYEKALKWSK